LPPASSVLGAECGHQWKARGAVAPRLTQDHPPAQDVGAGSHALGGHGGFCRGNTLAQLGQELL